MSSIEKKIALRDILQDAALDSAPSFPDFAAVYEKAEQRPRTVRRVAFSAALVGMAAAASFWVGALFWQSRNAGDVALLDSWSESTAAQVVTVSTTGGEQNTIVLASTTVHPVNQFVQDLWERSSAGL